MYKFIYQIKTKLALYFMS